jgi:cobalamin biosynthesis Mg chelatase CobN
MAQEQTQKQDESTMSIMLWTGGALLVVVLLAIYAAM